jgi:hypothetical protein
MAMSVYTEVLKSMLQHNPCGICSASVAADVATLQCRLDNEGMHFATHLLPAFAKAVENGLENGRYEVPSGFKRSKRNPGLPAFMQDVLSIIFDGDGYLRPIVDWSDIIRADRTEDVSDWTQVARPGPVEYVAAAIAHIRQIGYVFKKLQLPYPERLNDERIASWIQIEQELPDPDSSADSADELLTEAAEVILQLLGGEPDLTGFNPRHGPGAVSTGERDHQKWAFRRTYDDLSSVFGLDYFTVGGSREIADRKYWFQNRDHLAGGCSKMVLVFKDSGGPRVILAEPLEFMWIQQGLKGLMVDLLERRSHLRINFRDQGVNARLALSGSRRRSWATIDLKDASNWNSLWLVKRLMPPSWFKLLLASRSSAAVLPDGSVHLLKMFAGMGSATTFPVEAAVFYALAVATLVCTYKCSRQWAMAHVYTYGDDNIVPREYARGVMDVFERYHLKVNRSKSFVDGFFRESCGTDAFAGYNVTPVRLKKPFAEARRGSVGLLSLTEFARGLQAKRYSAAAEIVYREVERISGPLPFGTSDSGYLCRHVDSPLAAFSLSKERGFKVRVHSTSDPLKPSYQRLEVMALSPVKVKRPAGLSGWVRLLRNLTMGPGDDPDKVTRRSDLASLYPRWSPV